MDDESGASPPRLTSVALAVKQVVNPDEWGVGVSENDDTYRKWTRHVRTYHRWYTMYERKCSVCSDPIDAGEPYIGRIYAEALPKPLRNRKGKLVYSRMWTEYEHWLCPWNLDDAEREAQRIMAEMDREERAQQREAA